MMICDHIPPPEKILITRLRFIGDVALTTPVIRALREVYPRSRLFYLAEPTPASILKGHPYLDGVLVLDREKIQRQSLWDQIREHIRFVRMLRKHGFDMVIDLFGNPRSALLTWVSGAPWRVGYDVRGRGVVYNIKIRRGDSLSAVDAGLDAVRTLGFQVEAMEPSLPTLEEETIWTRQWLHEAGVTSSDVIIALNPGASWPAKQWPAERFAELADRLIDGKKAMVLLIQGPEMQELMQRVRASMTHAPLITDVWPLPRLAALIRQCRVFVSNDCGPMHIAAAVGTPTIGLFGPSRPEIWFPYSVEKGHMALRPSGIECCGRDFCVHPSPCIYRITVEQALAAVERAMRVKLYSDCSGEAGL